MRSPLGRLLVSAETKLTLGTLEGTILFTSKERDAETGLDYFGARYIGSTQGRFASPDVAGAASQVRKHSTNTGMHLTTRSPYIDLNGFYEQYVHRELTYALALAVEINSSATWHTASADQWIDDSPATSGL